MADAIKCDLTGKLVEGTGVPHVEMEVAEGLRIRAMVMVRLRGKPNESWSQGRMAPAGAKLVQDALEKIQLPTAAAKK